MSWWDDFNFSDSWDKWGDDVIKAGATLGAGYMASKAAKDSAGAEREAAQLAWERSQPWNVGGVFGAATFDPETRTALHTLSPEMQAELDATLASSAAQRDQIAALGADPVSMGKTFYEQQKALYAPEQEQQRLALENRLMGQGMLGSSGGRARQEALLTAQAQQDAAAQMAGYDKAQAMLDKYRARRSSDLALAQTIGNIGSGYMQSGMGIGSDLSNIAQTAASMEQSAAQGISDATAGMWGGAAKAFAGYNKPTK